MNTQEAFEILGEVKSRLFLGQMWNMTKEGHEAREFPSFEEMASDEDVNSVRDLEFHYSKEIRSKVEVETVRPFYIRIESYIQKLEDNENLEKSPKAFLYELYGDLEAERSRIVKEMSDDRLSESERKGLRYAEQTISKAVHEIMRWRFPRPEELKNNS